MQKLKISDQIHFGKQVAGKMQRQSILARPSIRYRLHQRTPTVDYRILKVRQGRNDQQTEDQQLRDQLYRQRPPPPDVRQGLGQQGYGQGQGYGPPSGPPYDYNNVQPGPPPPPQRNASFYQILAGVIFGLGFGAWFGQEANFQNSQNVASTEIIDEQTPNQSICLQNGYGAMVYDQRMFVSFNPFNIYVTQPEVKPGCILRSSSFSVLERRGLVDRNQSQSCKNRMNTFGFVGDLNKNPEISCLYHQEDAENQFLVNPKAATMGDGEADTNRNGD